MSAADFTDDPAFTPAERAARRGQASDLEFRAGLLEATGDPVAVRYAAELRAQADLLRYQAETGEVW